MARSEPGDFWPTNRKRSVPAMAGRWRMTSARASRKGSGGV